jgi:formate-dependent phosphoribosylglycinamide formyltransferase (GAR transformylase)
MKIDIQTTSPAASDSGKGDIMHLEETNMTKTEKIAAIDAMAEDPSVTLESFAHLDINKILRKVDMRLVPMLTVLVSLREIKSLQKMIC